MFQKTCVQYFDILLHSFRCDVENVIFDDVPKKISQNLSDRRARDESDFTRGISLAQ